MTNEAVSAGVRQELLAGLDEGLRGAVESVADLADVPVGERVAIFERAHGDLRAALARPGDPQG